MLDTSKQDSHTLDNSHLLSDFSEVEEDVDLIDEENENEDVDFVPFYDVDEEEEGDEDEESRVWIETDDSEEEGTDYNNFETDESDQSENSGRRNGASNSTDKSDKMHQNFDSLHSCYQCSFQLRNGPNWMGVDDPYALKLSNSSANLPLGASSHETLKMLASMSSIAVPSDLRSDGATTSKTQSSLTFQSLRGLHHDWILSLKSSLSIPYRIEPS